MSDPNRIMRREANVIWLTSPADAPRDDSQTGEASRTSHVAWALLACSLVVGALAIDVRAPADGTRAVSAAGTGFGGLAAAEMGMASGHLTQFAARVAASSLEAEADKARPAASHDGAADWCAMRVDGETARADRAGENDYAGAGGFATEPDA